MSLGISAGGRDHVLYQYAVYAKKAFPDNWQTKIGKFNYQYFEPELSIEQVNKTIKQHEKQDYQYKCKDQPMCSVCNPVQCKLRKHGIGSAYQHQLTDLQKLESDEPVWFLNVDGKRIELDTDTLYDQNRFRKKCMDVLTVLPDAMGGDDWTKKLQTLMADADVIKMEEEISKGGQFDQHLKSFLTDQGISDDVRDLLVGNPVRKRINIKNDEDQTEEIDAILFNPKDVVDYCTKKKFTALDQTRMILRIKESFKGDSHKLSVDNNKKYVWFVPDDFQKPKDIEIPDMKKAEPF